MGYRTLLVKSEGLGRHDEKSDSLPLLGMFSHGLYYDYERCR